VDASQEVARAEEEAQRRRDQEIEELQVRMDVWAPKYLVIGCSSRSDCSGSSSSSVVVVVVVVLLLLPSSCPTNLTPFFILHHHHPPPIITGRVGVFESTAT